VRQVPQWHDHRQFFSLSKGGGQAQGPPPKYAPEHRA